MHFVDGSSASGAFEVSSQLIRVKFLDKSKSATDESIWLKLFPSSRPEWGRCQFLFDRHAREYDWLVVYDDLPSISGERHTLWAEELACPTEHSLLITAEPPTVKIYGRHFLRQFRWVLSSQPAWALDHHPGHILQQPALVWFYSDQKPRGSYDALMADFPDNKTRQISTLCSSKQQRHTLHNQRYAFTLALKERLPELDIFGHGVCFLQEKADGLDSYRYHLAIENYYGPHHWTEKLADAFLGGCLPFYYGCPNVFDYFPQDSLIPIDINDFESSLRIIIEAMDNNAYEQRLPAIRQARNLVLNHYSTLATVAEIVEQRHDSDRPVAPLGTRICSRHRLREHWPILLADGVEKIVGKIKLALGSS